MEVREGPGPGDARLRWLQGPFTLVDLEPGALAASVSSPPTKARRGVGVAVFAVGMVLALLGGGYGLYSSYVDWQLSQTLPLDQDPSALPPLPQRVALAPSPGAGGTASVSSVPQGPRPPAEPATRILVPRIQVDAPVVELGTKVEKGRVVWETPAHAVGHYKLTALPGQGGNIVMSGHISSPFRGEGSVLRRLPELQVGDLVIVHTWNREYRYRVAAREIVRPDAVQVMQSTGQEVLTLISCYPDLIYSHRLVVRALPTSP